MGQFVNQRGEQFLAHRAMYPRGALVGGGAIRQRWQQFAVEFDEVAAGAAVGMFRQVVPPAHAHVAIQLLQHAWRQSGQGFVEQYLGGGTFGGLQRLAFQGQPQRRASLAGETGQYRRQQPGVGRFHRARMVSASA